MRRQRVARATGEWDARGVEATERGARMQGLDGLGARAEEIAEGDGAFSGSSVDTSEELDEACAGIGG